MPQFLRLVGMIAAIAGVYTLYVYRIGRVSPIVALILLSMATIKAFNIQTVFYVDQIAERLVRIERILQRSHDGNSVWQMLDSTKHAHHLVWQAADALSGAKTMAWLAVALETLEEGVVNVYLISSALFNGGVPMRAITLSVYGVVPTVMSFALLCWSCGRCVRAVGLTRNSTELRS